MSGLAISLVIYELPEVLGTHGGGGRGASAEGAHHGINGWTLLVALVTIIVFVVVRKRWPSLPSKLIGLAAGTAVAALITGLIAGADVGPARSVPRQDSPAGRVAAGVLPRRRRPGAALRLRPSGHGARDRRRGLARQPARRRRRSGWSARHRAPSEPAADGAGLRQSRLVAVRRRAGRLLVASRDDDASRGRPQARLEHRHHDHARRCCCFTARRCCS